MWRAREAAVEPDRMFRRQGGAPATVVEPRRHDTKTAHGLRAKVHGSRAPADG